MALTPGMAIRIVANVAELKKAMAEGRNTVVATTAAMSKMATSFKGDRLINKANAVTAAIDKIGGVSKLTAAEQARVNRTVTAALEKYRALGKQAPDALKRLAAETRTTVTAAERLTQAGHKLTSIGQGARNAGLTLSATLTAPIVAAGLALSKLAIDFESSFAGVRKTVNATEPEFAQLAQGFRDLSKEIPINVNEINRIGEAAGQLGIKTENIVGFTTVMAQLGVTTNLSSDEAASALARLANITGLPQTEFDRLGSTLVDLGNNFATTEQEILEFGLRIAGAGKVAGLSESQILAIGAAMSSVGVKAEAGGTAVQKVLLKMTEAVATSNDSLALFASAAGISARDFASAFRDDAGAAFTAFVEGLGTAGDDVFAVFENLGLDAERVKRSFLSLSGAGDLLNRSMADSATAWRENTALTKEAEERFKTTASQLTLLWNRTKDVGITVGNALLPLILSTVKAFETFIPKLEALARGFAGLPVGVQATIVGVALLVAGIGPLLAIVGQLAIALGGVAGLLGTYGAASTTAAAPTLTLAAATNTLTVSMGLLAKAASVVGIAIGAWKVTTWLLEWAEMTDAQGLMMAGFWATSEAEHAAAQEAALVTHEWKSMADSMTAWTLDSAKGIERLRALQVESIGTAKTSGELDTIFGNVSQAGGVAWETIEKLATRARMLDESGQELTPTMATLVAQLDAADLAAKAAAGGVTELSDDAKKLRDQLSDAGLAGDVATLEAAWRSLTPVQQANELVMRRAAETALALKERGGDLTTQLDELAASAWALTQNGLVPMAREVNVGALEMGRAGRMSEEMKVKLLSAREGVIQGTTSFIGFATVVDKGRLEMERVKREAERTGVVLVSVSERIKNAFTNTLGDLNNVFQAAFEGGGGIGGAVKSLTTNLVAGLTNMIPVVGPIISQFAGAITAGLGKIGGFFKGLFGGPSDIELEAREMVRVFEDTIIGSLDAGQLSEATGER